LSYYYYIIINTEYNYYIYNDGLLEECDKEQNVTVTVATTAYCYKRILQNALSNVTYWSSHRQTGAPTINIQSSLRTAPICVNVALYCYLVATVVDIQSVNSQICVYIYTYFRQYRNSDGVKVI